MLRSSEYERRRDAVCVFGGADDHLTRSLMRASRFLGGGIAVATAGVLLVLIGRARAEPRPPVLNLVSIEPAGMIDDSGAEMWLVTFNIRNNNPDTRPDSHRNDL